MWASTTTHKVAPGHSGALTDPTMVWSDMMLFCRGGKFMILRLGTRWPDWLHPGSACALNGSPHGHVLTYEGVAGPEHYNFKRGTPRPG